MSELRLFPRVQTQLQVEVSNQLKETAQAWVRNLSPGGMMIDGDIAFKEMISANLDKDPLVKPIEVTVTLRLPNDPVPFRSSCRLVFVRRLSQLEFNFGFRFVDMGAEMAGKLQRYVSRSISPANDHSSRSA
ncbi:MAG: PilZ domain-containing protein [Motiliproteus sp.]|nr:PilZ domain-containing protein [Motiliproteus sp.]MCW9051405.1 PilZ domain-containing protein [Motiliproteus sp.]